METRFLLNGAEVTAETGPTVTLLDWLREGRGLTGTKEGCNEGDCGACTVVVTGPDGVARGLNACILFVPQLAARAVRTVEGIGTPDAPHPVQAAMVAQHGSQCGFCTPGFIAGMAAAHAQGRRDFNEALAGNLCRCTGYAPIIRAAEAAADAPVPPWVAADAAWAGGQSPAATPARPQTEDELARWYAANPDGTLIAGATDVGLWVTKGLRDLKPVAFLNGIAEMQRIDRRGDTLRVGAGVTVEALRLALRDSHPAFAELLRRFGADQVRNAATIGGNIANGSPIGDAAPALIALGATLHLRRGDTVRDLPIEAFFLDYRKQDRAPGEFVTAVTFPAASPDLRCWKVSKRFDDDISAVCGCFDVRVVDGVCTHARIAFGGMAGTPRRALRAEAALQGQRWTMDAVRAAQAAVAQDFAPLSDMRASAAYRTRVAQNLVLRLWNGLSGQKTTVLEVAP